MSKKRGKSSSAPGRWEADLIVSALEDENWKVSVNFIVENQLGDSLHIKHLANVIKIPQRRLFSVIQKEDLIALIDEIGNPKTRKIKDLPQYFEITEVIKTMQDAGEEIPIHLWAKLIKFALMDVKTNELKRRDMEAKMKDEKEKGKGSGKKRPRTKSPVKGGKGKKTPEPQLPKKDWSSLKKRGEEDTGNKYIDDEPDDGVQHYVFVSGFRQAPLFTLLAELGVNVSSVIKIQSDSYATIEIVKSQMTDLTQAEVSKDEDTRAVEKEWNEMKEKELAVFWKLLPVVLQRAPQNSRLQDISILEYTVQEPIHPADWNDADNLIGYGTALFEDLACAVYTSLDWRRQYLNYIKNMNLLHVPLHGEVERTEQQPSEQAYPPSAQSVTGKRDKGKAAAAVEPAPDDFVPPLHIEQVAKEVDMRYYNDLMDLVPQESVSVPLIMHCLLEQIRAIEQDLIPPSEIPSEQRNDGIHLALADCISDALESLSLTEEERKALSGDFPSLDENFESEVQVKNKKSLEPSLMQYGDNVMVRTHHLATFHDFHPKSAEEALLHRLPCARLWDYQHTSPQLSKERSARLQELLRNCTMLSGDSDGVITYSEIDRAFKQFVFETMNMSSVDENGYITKPEPEDNLESPWDDPYTLAVRIGTYLDRTRNDPEEERADKETPKESSLEIFEKENPALVPKRVLDNWCYAEHFHPEVFLQVLTDASEAYPSLDTYYHKRDHSLLAVFHCPMNKKLYATEEWSTSLHSDVGFRNYLEYVSESISDWTKCEEEKYQAELLKRELEKVQAAQTSTEASVTTLPPLPPPSTGPGKRPRSKSPKKGSRKGSASRSSSKLGPTGDEITYSSPFIRAGSLKAQLEEKAKLQEEEEKKKVEKESKQQSGRKTSKTKSASSKTSQDGKRPGSSKASKAGRRSPKSKSRSLSRSRSRSSSAERENATVVETPKPIQPNLPFTGYDVGNNLVNLYGKTSYLYPCDGGIIKAEKIVCKKGSTTVSTTIRKDGHVFLVHLIDPKDPEEDKELDELFPKTKAKKDEITEKSELESAEKEKDEDPVSRLSSRTNEPFEEKPCHSKFGSWNAALCDGMTLSFSCYGDSGECAATSKAEAKLMKLLGEIPCASSPTPAPPDTGTPKKGKGRGKSPRGRSPRGKSPKGKRKSDPDKEAEAMRLEEERMKEELERKLREAKEAEEERKRKKQPPFPQLYVSTPDGLSVRYQLDPTATTENCMTGEMQNKLMVRQSYPYKTLGKQKTESFRAHPAMEEVSRCIKSDGTVIKVMKDGSSKILFVDGTTCFNHGSGPLVQERNVPSTPHGMLSARTRQMQGRFSAGEQRNTTSPGSKKGSKGRKYSVKSHPNTSGTDPSVSGTEGGGGAGGTLNAAAGLEADVGASAEADLERASSWHTVTMDGESYVSKPNGKKLAKEPLLCYRATDPVTGEVLMSREDHVIRVERPDGSVICEHSDGTRITQYNCEIEKSLYEAEGEESESTVNAVNTVRHVRVECPGFATISFNCDEGSCLTAFGSGTNLLTTPDPTYQMSHWNGGRLDIDREGTVTYTPRPDNDLYVGIANEGETEEGTDVSNPNDHVFEGQMAPLGSYVMRHNADICCEALDHEGNVFQVRKYGDINVMNPANEAASSGESISFLPQVSTTSDPLDHHPPRFFVIHENGSGTELLRFKDVQEYLSDAELDPTTAVIKEPLPDTPGVLGITVMRPHFGNSSEAWLTQKMEENIIPGNIRSRDLALFPPIEYKKSGPAFGTSAGKGVAVGSVPAISEPLPTPPCPAVLELRQLVQFQPVTNELRSRLKRNLLEIGNIVLNREQQRAGADPRSWEENVRANDLLSLVLEFDEGQITPKISTAPQPSGQPGEGGNTKKSTKAAAVHEQQAPNIIRAIYEESVTSPPAPKPDPPKNKLTQDDWDRIRRGIEEEKLGLQALKHRNVPPYFESKEGRAWLMTQAPDLDAMSRQLAPDPRKDGTEAKMARRENEKDRKPPMQKPGQTTETNTTPTQSRASENGTTVNIQVPDTPSKMRPTNPTPGHASGKGTPTKVRPENPTPIAASQARTVRPSNPTPSHAYGGGSNVARQSVPDGTYGQFPPSPIPENPTSAQRREGSTLYEESTSSDMALPMDTTAGSDLVMTRSLLYDVSGEVRKEKVRLPLSILSDKPAAIPNKQFKSVEEPVRRKVKTSSVAETVNKGIAKRGFELLPPEIVFGVLKEGNTYSYTARLKNTGIDTCRFKVKQPPPGTGMRVHYTPGPVAAGMDTLVHIECYAIAVGVEGDSGIGTINHQLEIVTETEMLCLPISAIVLTAHDYDRRTDNMPPGGKAPGVKLLSAKPPSREGIIRPMKVTS